MPAKTLAAVCAALLFAVASFDMARAASWIEVNWENVTVDEIRLLLYTGADPLAKNADGATPLHWAARYANNPTVITALIDGGANVAAINANPAVIAALIEAGAGVNALDDGGCPPLRYALSENINALKHFGANPLSGFLKCKTG